MLPANANYEMRNLGTVCLRKKRLNTLIHTWKPRVFSSLGNVLRLNPICPEKFFAVGLKQSSLGCFFRSPLQMTQLKEIAPSNTPVNCCSRLGQGGGFPKPWILSIETWPEFPLLACHSPHWCLSPHFMLSQQTPHSSWVDVGIPLGAVGSWPLAMLSRHYLRPERKVWRCSSATTTCRRET